MSKRTDNHFWLKLHYKDWHLSHSLMLCSMQARGVAVEAEMLMKHSPAPGHLLKPNGTPLTVTEFARLAVGDEKEIAAGLKELIEQGEFIEDENGTIYCPRLVKQGGRSHKMRDVADARWNTERNAVRTAPRNASRNAQRTTKRIAKRNGASEL